MSKQQILLVLATTFLLFGCKGNGNGDDPITPTRVDSDQSADALAAFGKIENGENYKLVLGLPDRNAGRVPAIDAAVIDSCIDFLDENFEVGEAKCANSSQKVIKLTAGMFKQTCFLQDSKPKVATQTLSMECDEIQLFLYSFEPPLRAEVQ